MLLTGDAATWWRGIKSEVATFDEALARLQKAYGSVKPAYKIYRELFSSEQHEDVPTDIFIAKCRALLAGLPEPKLPESVQINMIYGLLRRDIRKVVPRESVSTFATSKNPGRKTIKPPEKKVEVLAWPDTSLQVAAALSVETSVMSTAGN